MASTWVFRDVAYTELHDARGWTYWEPNTESLIKALTEITAFAAEKNMNVVSVMHLQKQAGRDYEMKGEYMRHNDSFHTDYKAGHSYKVYDYGVVIVAFLSD